MSDTRPLKNITFFTLPLIVKFHQDESPHQEQYIDKMEVKDFDESLGKKPRIFSGKSATLEEAVLQNFIKSFTRIMDQVHVS